MGEPAISSAAHLPFWLCTQLYRAFVTAPTHALPLPRTELVLARRPIKFLGPRSVKDPGGQPHSQHCPDEPALTARCPQAHRSAFQHP